MKTFQTGVAMFLAILFVLTALAAQFLFTLESEAFAPQTYQAAFANDEFYERIPTLLAQSMTSSPIESLPLAMRGLTQENWEHFFRDLLPPETLKAMGDQALGSVFSYLNSRSDTASLSLQPLKERLTSQAGTQAVINLMRTQPVCTLAEIAKIGMSLLTQQELSLCNPPENLYPVVLPLIQGQLQLAAAAIPNDITLAQATPEPGKADPRDRLQVVRLGMRLSPVIPLVLLLLLTFVVVRSLKDWLVWWGGPLLVTGAASAVMALTGAPIVSYMLGQFLLTRMPVYLPAVLLQNGSQLAGAIVNQMLQPILIEGVILALLGAGLLLLAFLATRLAKPSV